MISSGVKRLRRRAVSVEIGLKIHRYPKHVIMATRESSMDLLKSLSASHFKDAKSADARWRSALLSHGDAKTSERHGTSCPHENMTKPRTWRRNETATGRVADSSLIKFWRRDRRFLHLRRRSHVRIALPWFDFTSPDLRTSPSYPIA